MDNIVYASFWRRAGAVLLDGLIVSVGNSLVTVVVNLVVRQEAVASTITQIISLIISVGYYVYFIGNRGQTPGKMVLKIKVQKLEDGSNLGYPGAFMREVLGKFVSGVVFGLGYLWMIRDKDKQTWHDKIAKSVVVKI
ncbi:MAG: RDD family protein [Patescibacteria group bacterium]